MPSCSRLFREQVTNMPNRLKRLPSSTNPAIEIMSPHSFRGDFEFWEIPTKEKLMATVGWYGSVRVWEGTNNEQFSG